MKRTWQKWTQEQDDLPRKYWAQPGAIKLHIDEFGGRSIQSVINRASSLGLGRRGEGMRVITPVSVSAIVRELRVAPDGMDAKELSAKTGIERNQVTKRLNAMHAVSEVHIHSWERFSVSGKYTRVWAFGPGKDAKKPAAMKPAARERRRLKQMLRDDPAKYEDRLARRRLNRQKREGKIVRRDPIVAALFGSGAA